MHGKFTQHSWNATWHSWNLLFSHGISPARMMCATRVLTLSFAALHSQLGLQLFKAQLCVQQSHTQIHALQTQKCNFLLRNHFSTTHQNFRTICWNGSSCILFFRNAWEVNRYWNKINIYTYITHAGTEWVKWHNTGSSYISYPPGIKCNNLQTCRYSLSEMICPHEKYLHTIGQ